MENACERADDVGGALAFERYGTEPRLRPSAVLARIDQ
jgi:hypothetical protein